MMHKTVFTILLYIMALLPSLATQAQTVGEWRDSLTSISRQIEQHPRSTDLRLRKAAINIELGQWDYAVEEYGRVLDIDQKNPAALFYRAYANTHLRHYDLAANDYSSFLTIVPKHFEAQYGLAMVKRMMGKQAETLDELNRLVQMFPDSAVAYAARASYEAELRKYDIAVFDWEEAQRISPQNAEYAIAEADLLLGLGRNGEALAVLEEAVRRGIARQRLKNWIDKCK